MVLSAKQIDDVLGRAVAAWRGAFDEPPPEVSEEIEDELPYLPLEAQVPITEAIRWAGYDALRSAVLTAIEEEAR